jgi:hypothetical protein
MRARSPSCVAIATAAELQRSSWRPSQLHPSSARPTRFCKRPPSQVGHPKPVHRSPRPHPCMPHSALLHHSRPCPIVQRPSSLRVMHHNTLVEVVRHALRRSLEGGSHYGNIHSWSSAEKPRWVRRCRSREPNSTPRCSGPMVQNEVPGKPARHMGADPAQQQVSTFTHSRKTCKLALEQYYCRFHG